MVYREEAYREVFPEVKIEKIIPKQPESMIEVESSLLFLEEGVCYDQCILLDKLY